MKKIVVFLLAVMMVFVCVACGDSSDNGEEAATILAFYSVKSAEGEFIVEVQNLGGVYSEMYDENGIYIKFKGSEEKIFDSQGNPISREDINYGDTLEIHYSGKLSSKNPKTIKAYKVVDISK